MKCLLHELNFTLRLSGAWSTHSSIPVGCYMLHISNTSLNYLYIVQSSNKLVLVCAYYHDNIVTREGHELNRHEMRDRSKGAISQSRLLGFAGERRGSNPYDQLEILNGGMERRWSILATNTRRVHDLRSRIRERYTTYGYVC